MNEYCIPRAYPQTSPITPRTDISREQQSSSRDPHLSSLLLYVLHIPGEALLVMTAFVTFNLKTPS